MAESLCENLKTGINFCRAAFHAGTEGRGVRRMPLKRRAPYKTPILVLHRLLSLNYSALNVAG